jgi:hypothetical protein
MRRTLFGGWGTALDDAAFACAVTALGVLYGRTRRTDGPMLAARLRDSNLAATLQWAAGEDTLVRWRYVKMVRGTSACRLCADRSNRVLV